MTTVVREWEADDTLDGGSAYAQPHGKPKTTVDSLRWAKPMELYRPFLSYSELGALVSSTPSKMHDALEAILGLEQLKAADERLGHARKSLEDTSKQAKGLLPSLQARLAGHPDERAAAVQLSSRNASQTSTASPRCPAAGTPLR